MNSTELIGHCKTPFYTSIDEICKIDETYKNSTREFNTKLYGNIHLQLPTTTPIRLVYGNQTGFNSSIKIEENERKYITLLTELSSKWDKGSHGFIGILKTFVVNQVKTVIDYFHILDSKFVKVDLSNDNSVFFQSKIDDFNVYFELFFEENNNSDVEAIANIYKDGECVFAFGGSIEETFSKIRTNVSRPLWAHTNSSTPNGLSESTSAFWGI